MKHSPGNRFTDAQLLRLLRIEAQRLGRTPTQRDLQRPDRMCPHLSTYLDRFRSLGRAARAAGLRPNDRGFGPRKWTREMVIGQLQYQARELGRTPFYREVDVHRHVLERLFGSIGAALDAAGLHHRRRGGPQWLPIDARSRRERARMMAEYWKVPMPIAS